MSFVYFISNRDLYNVIDDNNIDGVDNKESVIDSEE